jgi:hypothetical protein
VKLFQVAADESQLTPKPPKLIWAHGLYRFSDYTEKVVRVGIPVKPIGIPN